eukprot:12434288-Ditylum_brightwellii.AAC.1
MTPECEKQQNQACTQDNHNVTIPIINPDAVRAIIEYQGAATAAVQTIMKCFTMKRQERPVFVR